MRKIWGLLLFVLFVPSVVYGYSNIAAPAGTGGTSWAMCDGTVKSMASNGLQSSKGSYTLPTNIVYMQQPQSAGAGSCTGGWVLQNSIDVRHPGDSNWRVCCPTGTQAVADSCQASGYECEAYIAGNMVDQGNVTPFDQAITGKGGDATAGGVPNMEGTVDYPGTDRLANSTLPSYVCFKDSINPAGRWMRWDNRVWNTQVYYMWTFAATSADSTSACDQVTGHPSGCTMSEALGLMPNCVSGVLMPGNVPADGWCYMTSVVPQYGPAIYDRAGRVSLQVPICGYGSSGFTSDLSKLPNCATDTGYADMTWYGQIIDKLCKTGFCAYYVPDGINRTVLGWPSHSGSPGGTPPTGWNSCNNICGSCKKDGSGVLWCGAYAPGGAGAPTEGQTSGSSGSGGTSGDSGSTSGGGGSDGGGDSSGAWVEPTPTPTAGEGYTGVSTFDELYNRWDAFMTNWHNSDPYILLDHLNGADSAGESVFDINLGNLGYEEGTLQFDLDADDFQGVWWIVGAMFVLSSLWLALKIVTLKGGHGV